MDRQAMLETIEKAYEARVRGDVDGVMRAFADKARFQINAAPSDAQLAHVVEGQDPLRNVMSQLIDGFTFTDMEVLDSVVEGDKAAVRRRFTVKANSTGKDSKDRSVRPV